MKAIALTTICCLALAAGASANPPPPADLEVDGGQERWRATRTFRLLWANPMVTTAPIVAAHYRVLDPTGAVVIGPVRLPWAATGVGKVEVPSTPAAYTAEVWLEDTKGLTSAPAAATLRFDDERPGDALALASSAWIGRAAFPLPIRLEHHGAAPLSGIRGYAVALSSSPGQLPCAEEDRCAEAETDLRGGAADDEYVIPGLPDGTSHLTAVVVSGAGMTSATPAAMALRVDRTSPEMTLSGVPDGWTNSAVQLTAAAVDRGSGMTEEAGGVRPFTAISVNGGAPTAATGPSVAATVFEEGIHRVAYYARDLAGNVNDGQNSNGIANLPPPVALVRVDRTPPLVSFASAQDPADPELIRVRVADALSGPDPVRGRIEVRRRGAGEPFAPLAPLPGPPGELRARWDSQSYAPAEYEFRALAHDLAGNSAATRSRSDGAAMILTSPLKTTASLHVGLGNGARRLLVPYGSGVRLSGRLSAGEEPLGSRQVQIVERFGDGGPPPRVSTANTDPTGGFELELAPGPSREVTAAFAGAPNLSRAASATLALEVRGGLRLTASAKTATVGGAPLVFSGRVSGASAATPPEGKSIELQFRLPGRPWREFRTLRADRRGRFRYRYRFSDDDSRGVRFLFRAYAPAQGDWPYEPAGSKPVAVRGR